MSVAQLRALLGALAKAHARQGHTELAKTLEDLAARLKPADAETVASLVRRLRGPERVASAGR